MSRGATLPALLAGVVLIVLARLAVPAAPPLYDGVAVNEPYRYLTPGPGQTGSPTSYQGTTNVSGSTSPAFAAITAEIPPQAQLVAPDGAFVVAPGTAALGLSIEPVAAAAPPAGEEIAGNVYRVSVTDGSGAALEVNPAAMPTLVLRSPHPLSPGVIARYVDGAWQKLQTDTGGGSGLFSTNVSALGDFAVLVSSSTPGADILPFGVAAALITAVGAVGLVLVLRWDRRRSRTPASGSPGSPRTRRRRRDGQRRRGGGP